MLNESRLESLHELVGDGVQGLMEQADSVLDFYGYIVEAEDTEEYLEAIQQILEEEDLPEDARLQLEGFLDSMGKFAGRMIGGWKKGWHSGKGRALDEPAEKKPSFVQRLKAGYKAGLEKEYTPDMQKKVALQKYKKTSPKGREFYIKHSPGITKKDAPADPVKDSESNKTQRPPRMRRKTSPTLPGRYFMKHKSQEAEPAAPAAPAAPPASQPISKPAPKKPISKKVPVEKAKTPSGSGKESKEPSRVKNVVLKKKAGKDPVKQEKPKKSAIPQAKSTIKKVKTKKAASSEGKAARPKQDLTKKAVDAIAKAMSADDEVDPIK